MVAGGIIREIPVPPVPQVDSSLTGSPLVNSVATVLDETHGGEERVVLPDIGQDMRIANKSLPAFCRSEALDGF